MGRRRAGSRPPKVAARPNGLSTHFALFTYALSRLPPRQLPLLALYAYTIIQACKRGWIDREVAGKAGAAVVGVMSMVTGLLLSYRFSTAVAKWDEGKKVWVEVRTTIRDGVRMLSIAPPPALGLSLSETSSVPEDLGDTSTEEEKSPVKDKSSSSKSSASGTREKSQSKPNDVVGERVNELTGLMVGFAFALQHHLHGTRPLPQPPLCDLLPTPYLSSLKRTEARVRFAESHSGPSNSRAEREREQEDPFRPGIRRRSTGPPSAEERLMAGEDDWDLDSIRLRAEDALNRMTGNGEENAELRQQLSQLNLPKSEHDREKMENANGSQTGGGRIKSNLTAPHPPNLPLALLRLMEGYVTGLAEVVPEKGGWNDAKRERALGVVKALNDHLGDAERLSSNPPPLPLTLHLNHLLLIYLTALPLSLLCVVTHPLLLITITLLAGWCLLGLEALISEVGGVFGYSENHHPLPMYSNQILLESLDLHHDFVRYYRTRLVSRLGEDDPEVLELDKRCRRSGEEWLPSF